MTRRLLFGSIVFVASLSTLFAQAPQTSAPGRTATAPDTAAIVAGTPISTKQLDDKIGARLLQLRTQEYRLRKNALDEIVTTTLLDKEAAERKISTADLIAAEIDAKAKPVTEEEARAVYESARDRMGQVPEADAIQSIMNGMQRQRANQRRTEFAAELKAKHGVKLLLETPRFKIAPPIGPSMGPADAPVTLVEFSDFQCQYCARSAATVKQLFEKYPGKIRLVFQDFPLPNHKEAPKAAEAAACAHDQGKFWEMHDQLFQNQANLSVGELKRYAANVGLDAPAFSACLDTGKHAGEWKRTRALGEGYGISGTPAFFINGVPVFGAAPLQEFTTIIDDELARLAPPAAKTAAAKRP